MVTTYEDFKFKWEFPWAARPEVKKGFAGELLLKDYFEQKGYVVYLPVTEKSHGFDMLLYKDENYPFAVEVKTKASSEEFQETGIEKYLYERYSKLCDETKMKLLLVFVDERTKSFYGEFFHKLREPRQIGKFTYPKLTYRKGKTHPTYFFCLSTMKTLGKLSELEVRYLKTLGEEIKK